jgi:hypothetical protein
MNVGVGSVRSAQCNVEFVYQLSICSRAEEKHGNIFSFWPVAGPSGSTIVSSPSLQYANPSSSIHPCTRMRRGVSFNHINYKDSVALVVYELNMIKGHG